MPEKKDHAETDSIIAELEKLQDLYLQCRAVFPTIDNAQVGCRHLVTAPYYLKRGYVASMELKEPITSEFIERNRCLGKWVNENAIIRLYGIMEHHGLLEKINHNLQGAKEVDLMRRMRNAFTKTVLNYTPKQAKNVRLRKEVIKHFVLEEKDFSQGEIPTPIDTVVEPIFNGCREYIVAKCLAHNKSLH
jgi:hypothetical protein